MIKEKNKLFLKEKCEYSVFDSMYKSEDKGYVKVYGIKATVRTGSAIKKYSVNNISSNRKKVEKFADKLNRTGANPKVLNELVEDFLDTEYGI